MLIISDFDGTLSPKDVGYKVLRHFAADDGWEIISQAYEAGEVGSQEAYTRAASLFRVSREEMLRYVESFGTIDPYFRNFYDFCTENSFDVKIVSDGLDFYIEAILKKYDLQEIEYYANAVIFHTDETLSIEFPYRNVDCNKCGNCKSSILEKCRSVYEKIIYIGDGHSDVCPALKADVVFAKNILYRKCLENGKECILYSNFGDIKKCFTKDGVHVTPRK